jgi:hypothetical protein
MPIGLIDEERCMRAGLDLRRDFAKVQSHRFGVASGHDEGCPLGLFGADRGDIRSGFSPSPNTRTARAKKLAA